MISSILKTAGLITLIFGGWVLFTVQSGKDTGAGRLIDKASNLKASLVSTAKSLGDKKQSGSAPGKSVAKNSATSGEKDAAQTEDDGGNRNKSIVQTGKSASVDMEDKAENMKNEKVSLLAKAGHKENSSTNDNDKLFNTKTILPEKPAVQEPTDEQLQSAQKRLTKSILKLETVVNDFWRR